MDLAGTAIPRESAFNILLQNCAERQAVYERVPTANRSPSCPARTLLSSEQRTRLFSIPTDPAEMTRHYVLGADDLALVRARRRAGNRLGLRRSALRASPSGSACWTCRSRRRQPMIVFVAQQIAVDPALFADYAQRDQTRREHAVELQRYLRLRQLRSGRLAHLPSGGHRRGLGHGSRRTHRPGDARPSADANGVLLPAAAVLERIGLAAACARAKEDLRGSRGRPVRRGAGRARQDCSRSIRNCAAPASPGCGIIRSRPRPPTSSRCWIASNTRGGWESTQRAPDEFMPPASPGWSTKARS